MGSLVHFISSISGAKYGVNVLEVNPPGGVRGAGTNVVACVANLPWGPVDAITEITSTAELFDTFAPLVFDALDDYPALKAFLNKTFPNSIKIARISPAGQATAARTFDDVSSGDSVVATARYPGLLGNSISVAWSVNSDDATARDATVTIGSSYSATYKRVATIVSAALVVTDPGDPYVAFTKASGATLVPAAIAATALTSGANGTAAAGDYSTCIDLFAGASVGWSVGFVAEPESALIDDINTALEAQANTLSRGLWVLCTPAAQAYATALTYVASYRTERTFYAWPKVKTTNLYDADRGEITVDGNSFAAVAIASVDPEKSPGGAPGAPFLRGITGLETEATITQLNNLNAAGVSPWFMSDALEGAILHNAVLTTLTSGKTKVFRRRMTDYIVQGIAAYLERFVGEILDVDLVNRRLGAVTAPEAGVVRQFLADLKKDGLNGRIRDYSLDEFGGNVQSNIDAGQWILILAVKLFSVQEQIVLQAQIGETVQITEV